MSEFKETVTTSQDEGTNNSGVEVQQKTRKVDTRSVASSSSIATNVAWFIVGAIEISLAFRFVLKLFGANPNSGFVDFIYSISDILTAPFDSIFGVTKAVSGTTHSVFEPSILVAAAVWALAGWGVVKLLNINHEA
jgi:hypothetical protein